MVRHFWVIGVFIIGLTLPAHAQPPERFRLDFGFGYLYAPNSRGFLGGAFAPRAGLAGPTDVLMLFEVSATAHVTERLSLSAGIPFGWVKEFEHTHTPQDTAIRAHRGRKEFGEFPFPFGEDEFGIGDVYAGVGYQLFEEHQLLPFSPGVYVQAEGGAPTADFAGLGTGLWRTTGRVSLAKSLHPRFSLFTTGSYSHFFQDKNTEVDDIWSYGGGATIGITPSVLLTLQLEEVAGGTLKEDDQLIFPFTRDLRAGIGATVYSKGRPRFSIYLAAGGLQDEPTFLLTFRWAVLSL